VASYCTDAALAVSIRLTQDATLEQTVQGSTFALVCVAAAATAVATINPLTYFDGCATSSSKKPPDRSSKLVLRGVLHTAVTRRPSSRMKDELAQIVKEGARARPRWWLSVYCSDLCLEGLEIITEISV
jgi:hypothetical protein